MAETLMSWVEARVTTTAELANELGDQLMSLGAKAVTFQDAGDQPIYEPSPETPRLWHDTLVIGLFDSEQSIEPLICFLETQQSLGIFKNFHLHPLQDQDWERKCLENFHPIRCGKRLWICPSWITPPHPDQVNVILDPGLAFGTGTHATTALCLAWLDEHITREPHIIDYGCGSGILGIAALKLGAQHVLAIDNDPQALEATRLNAERNQLTDVQLKTQLPNSRFLYSADVLIANILAKPLIELAPEFAKLIKPQGKIILSGILKEQTNEVLEAYNPLFIINNILEKEGWVLLTGIRK